MSGFCFLLYILSALTTHREGVDPAWDDILDVFRHVTHPNQRPWLVENGALLLAFVLYEPIDIGLTLYNAGRDLLNGEFDAGTAVDLGLMALPGAWSILRRRGIIGHATDAGATLLHNPIIGMADSAADAVHAGFMLNSLYQDVNEGTLDLSTVANAGLLSMMLFGMASSSNMPNNNYDESNGLSRKKRIDDPPPSNLRIRRVFADHPFNIQAQVIRNEFLPSGKRNVATVYWRGLDNLSQSATISSRGSTYAISGQATTENRFGDAYEGLRYSTDAEPPYQYLDGHTYEDGITYHDGQNEYKRDGATDTEAKIVEHFTSQLTHESRGTIIIFTERAPCASCGGERGRGNGADGILAQFAERFPNINVIVYHRDDFTINK